MRTLNRIRNSRLSVASTLRPLSMLAILVVVGLMMTRASNPDTWRFLEKGFQSSDTSQVARMVYDSDSAAAKLPDGPVDDDSEEASAAAEEALAISDKGLQLGQEEMPLYWRLFGWVRRQSFSGLRQRAMNDAALNQFMLSPDATRGRLVQLKLNVRRILRYDAPENSAGVKDVYEIWGWTDESQAWPYVVVVPQLPAGMPIGSKVYERATFVGYFYKLQGYMAAGAGPNDKPLSAPLLIGRIAWQPAAVVKKSEADSTWVCWLGAVAVIFGIVRLGVWRYNASKSTVKRQNHAASNRVHDWLQSQSSNADNDRLESTYPCECHDDAMVPIVRQRGLKTPNPTVEGDS